MLKVGFISLVLALAVTLYVMAVTIAKKAYTDQARLKRFRIGTLVFLVVWLTYISVISLTGIFETPSMPPRIPLLLVLPAFAAFTYFFTNSRFRDFIAHIPLLWPLYVQGFRIKVELLLWGLAMQGILPRAATFAGYNYDIVIGITGPLLALLMYFTHRRSKWLLMVWNIAGLITLFVVVFILISQAYYFPMWGEHESILSKGFGLFPYTFLAGFLMPVAVFLHIVSIIKTSRLPS